MKSQQKYVERLYGGRKPFVNPYSPKNQPKFSPKPVWTPRAPPKTAFKQSRMGTSQGAVPAITNRGLFDLIEETDKKHRPMTKNLSNRGNRTTNISIQQLKVLQQAVDKPRISISNIESRKSILNVQPQPRMSILQAYSSEPRKSILSVTPRKSILHNLQPRKSILHNLQPRKSILNSLPGQTVRDQRRPTLNLHQNFVNLNPNYDVRKFDKIQAFKNLYQNKISQSLKQKIEIQKRADFQKFLQSGGKLSVQELKNLSPEYKEDYIKQVLKEDIDTRNYLIDTEENLAETLDQLTHLIDNLQDVDDTWQVSAKQMNQQIMKSAIKNGIVKKQKPGYFKEFHISDFTKNENHCQNCRSGTVCPQHKLVKKSIHNRGSYYR